MLTLVTDKRNNLELLAAKETELTERTKIAEEVYDMFRQDDSGEVREKLIDVMYENRDCRKKISRYAGESL